ncbi:hypothetical protein WJX74_004330 [Apatococcus lobatus]|uniref:t-SNARE coiled-coil homology domain-containing protein n=2 Tax=Apatococcus TaxID=904362 RepID=A0AAW1SLK0_9CHLO
MNDLLSSVKSDASAAPMRPAGNVHDIEAGAPTVPADPPQDKYMEAFFRDVSDIKGLLSVIRQKASKLSDAHESSKTITKSTQMKALRQKMQDDASEVTTLANQTKTRLEGLDKQNEQSLNRKGCGVGSSSERTRTAVTAALRKKLKDVMGEFQDLRQRLQEEYRETVERRVYTVTGKKASEEEIDKMIETGESENIFQKAIMEQGRGHVLDTLAEIQERHEAVKELEKSLLDLHQIFLDMAVLVEAQGEQLDNIEAQVAKSVEYVQQGTTALVDAKRLHKNTRKWLCIALIVVAVIVAIVIVVAIQPWKK